MRPAADLLLRRARLGDDLVDVRLRDGRVAGIAPRLPVDAESVDLDGRPLLRGLWDEHVHATQAALAGVWIPLGGTASAADALAVVRAAADRSGADEPLIGIGFQDGLWPDRPSRAALDAATGGRLAILISHDVHAVWISSAAARRFGVEPGEEGVLREAAAFAIGREANRLADDGIEHAMQALGRRASRLGVTGVVDLEMTWSRDAWAARVQGGWLGPRVEAGVYPQDLDRAAAAGGRTGDAVDDDGLLSVGPLKVLADGALNTRTAWCADPYPDGGNGLSTVERPELERLLRRGRDLGLVPAVHAIGDAAVTAVLDAFAAVGVGGRVEHAQLIADADVPRFAALGVTASVQPAHLLDDREVAARHWPGRTGRAYPLRALLDAGAALAFGSDAPVAPLDPWLAIRAAVDRARAGEEPWHPEQCLPFDAALRASTRGRPEPRVGDLADLVVLDGPAEEHVGEVAATLVHGRFTHRAL